MDKDRDARLARIKFSERNERKDIFREVELRVREKQSSDHKLDYRTALHMVFRADEDLHREYLTSVPPMHAAREE